MTSLETPLTCTPCGHTVDLRKEECKVVAFFETPAGFRTEWGCAHRPIGHIEGAFAVTISFECMLVVVTAWARKNLRSDHADPAQAL